MGHCTAIAAIPANCTGDDAISLLADFVDYIDIDDEPELGVRAPQRLGTEPDDSDCCCLFVVGGPAWGLMEGTSYHDDDYASHPLAHWMEDARMAARPVRYTYWRLGVHL